MGEPYYPTTSASSFFPKQSNLEEFIEKVSNFFTDDNEAAENYLPETPITGLPNQEPLQDFDQQLYNLQEGLRYRGPNNIPSEAEEEVQGILEEAEAPIDVGLLPSILTREITALTTELLWTTFWIKNPYDVDQFSPDAPPNLRNVNSIVDVIINNKNTFKKDPITKLQYFAPTISGEREGIVTSELLNTRWLEVVRFPSKYVPISTSIYKKVDLIVQLDSYNPFIVKEIFTTVTMKSNNNSYTNINPSLIDDNYLMSKGQYINYYWENKFYHDYVKVLSNDNSVSEKEIQDLAKCFRLVLEYAPSQFGIDMGLYGFYYVNPSDIYNNHYVEFPVKWAIPNSWRNSTFTDGVDVRYYKFAIHKRDDGSFYYIESDGNSANDRVVDGFMSDNQFRHRIPSQLVNYKFDAVKQTIHDDINNVVDPDDNPDNTVVDPNNNVVDPDNTVVDPDDNVVDPNNNEDIHPSETLNQYIQEEDGKLELNPEQITDNPTFGIPTNGSDPMNNEHEEPNNNLNNNNNIFPNNNIDNNTNNTNNNINSNTTTNNNIDSNTTTNNNNMSNNTFDTSSSPPSPSQTQTLTPNPTVSPTPSPTGNTATSSKSGSTVVLNDPKPCRTCGQTYGNGTNYGLLALGAILVVGLIVADK